MLYQSYKQLILTAIIVAASNATGAIDHSTTFQQGLEYLEYHLIALPKKQILKEHTHAGAAAALVTAAYGLSTINTETRSVEFSTNDLFKFGLLSGAVSTLYYQLYSCFRKNSIESEHFIAFVRNWEHHQSRTPEQFHELFNSLALLLDSQGELALKKYAREVLNLVEFHLSHKFASRYPRESSSTINDIKALSDIAKNVKEFTNK
jgi:hypothetical protein